jgi:hypothetical protein
VVRIVQPETLLRWHRAGFKALWRLAEPDAPRVAHRAGDGRADPVHGLGQQTLGRQRIRGELLKLGIEVSKRTVPGVHARGAASQTAWAALVNVSTKPRPRALGLRLSASLRRILPRRDHALPVAGMGDAAASQRAPLGCRSRLGGLLNYYCREAA